ncbi:MAG: hypothetical protein IT359_10630 [Gemmatimonadaceae bacterium]|nr:hypothetical protein [Gemmatimonadaceae bacterium]
MAILSALRGKARTIALVRKRADLPASEIVADWMRSPNARQMISRAGSIVHLAGNLKPERGDYQAANEATTEVLCSALRNGTSARVIFLSFVGASEVSSNAYLASKARAERALRQAASHVTVFRCTHIIGSPDRPGPTALTMLRRDAASVTILGSGQQVLAPVLRDDVVSAIIAALERGADGTFDLPGPESMTLDDLVRLLNNDPSVPIRHVPAPMARLLPIFSRNLPRALVDIMLADCVGDPSQVRGALDIELASLRRVWGRASVAPFPGPRRGHTPTF